MRIWSDRIRGILRATLSAEFFILPSGMLGANADEIVVSVDRTSRGWSDLAMGPPSTEDDADQSQNTNAVATCVPAYGKPHADAGARGFYLPRLKDETPFLIAGPRLYEYGTMDGTFPRVGRLDGDQGGVGNRRLPAPPSWRYSTPRTNRRS